MRLVNERAKEKNPKILCVCFSVLFVCLFVFVPGSCVPVKWMMRAWVHINGLNEYINSAVFFSVQWNTCILSTSFTIKTLCIHNQMAIGPDLYRVERSQLQSLRCIWGCIKGLVHPNYKRPSNSLLYVVMHIVLLLLAQVLAYLLLFPAVRWNSFMVLTALKIEIQHVVPDQMLKAPWNMIKPHV